MDFKLFLSTFVLIFLAELGDKTQLAAMARTAGGEGGKWVIFLAASSALVLSTLIAVLIGAGIRRTGLPEQGVRAAAGVLFIVLGSLLLYRVLFPRKEVILPRPAAPGALGRAVLEVAADFEESSALDYRALAAETTDPQRRRLLMALADDEESHVRRLRSLDVAHPQTSPAALDPSVPPAVRAAPETSDEIAVLNAAIEHELAAAGFYRAAAEAAHVPGIKPVLAQLAIEESQHAERLQSFREAGRSEPQDDRRTTS